MRDKPIYDKKVTIGSVLVGLGSLAIGASLKLALQLIALANDAPVVEADPVLGAFDFLVTWRTGFHMSSGFDGQPTWCTTRGGTIT